MLVVFTAVRGFLARRRVGRMKAEASKQAQQVSVLLEQIADLSIKLHDAEAKKIAEDANIPKGNRS